MTRNEYIASIMLEAADILREEDDDILDESIIEDADDYIIESGGQNNAHERMLHEMNKANAKKATEKDKIEVYGNDYLTNPDVKKMVDSAYNKIANNNKYKKDFRQGGVISRHKYSDYGAQQADFSRWHTNYKVDENNPLTDKQKDLHNKINRRAEIAATKKK